MDTSEGNTVTRGANWGGWDLLLVAVAGVAGGGVGEGLVRLVREGRVGAAGGDIVRLRVGLLHLVGGVLKQCK